MPQPSHLPKRKQKRRSTEPCCLAVILMSSYARAWLCATILGRKWKAGAVTILQPVIHERLLCSAGYRKLRARGTINSYSCPDFGCIEVLSNPPQAPLGGGVHSRGLASRKGGGRMFLVRLGYKQSLGLEMGKMTSLHSSMESME